MCFQLYPQACLLDAIYPYMVLQGLWNTWERLLQRDKEDTLKIPVDHWEFRSFLRQEAERIESGLKKVFVNVEKRRSWLRDTNSIRHPAEKI